MTVPRRMMEEMFGEKGPRPYAWKITRDHLEAEGSPSSAVGTQGPEHSSQAALDDLVSETGGEWFRMYDDDEILYYEGYLTGDYSGFEPLDDYGEGWAGCTRIAYPDVNGEWRQL